MCDYVFMCMFRLTDASLFIISAAVDAAASVALADVAFVCLLAASLKTREWIYRNNNNQES